MSGRFWVVLLLTATAFRPLTQAEDLSGRVRKAVEHITLDQPGTKPFHLKAVLAPTLLRDSDSGRSGEIEMWWESPTRWKRELRSPSFHQIEIVNDGRDWQRNEGDFFPEWLREIAVELVRPVPPLQDVLEHAKSAEVRRMMGQTSLDWVTNTGTAEVHNIRRTVVAMREDSGELLYAFGFGWGGGFHDYQNFHGRQIAHTVSLGSPECTAKVVTLEDLGDVPSGFFDAPAKDGDPQLLQTVLIDEITLRKNLLLLEPSPWPPLENGAIEGNVTTNVVVDRSGKVRETGSIVSENSAINDAGRQRILAMQFKPFLVNGVPVQAMSQITLPFKTVRPAGSEVFDTARSYFERGRKVGFPEAGTAPYVLRAEFEAGTKTGPAKGRYEDTWLSDSRWRREIWFENSHYVRSRDGDKQYQLAEGLEVGLLELVLRIIEPIPALATFQESDWRIKRETISEIRAVRVLAGYESPEGKLDPEQARGYWFDDNGLLLKTFFNGIESRRSDFQDFAGIKFSHHVEVLKEGHLAIRISVTEVTSPGEVPAKTFELKGHSSERTFTSEVR